MPTDGAPEAEVVALTRELIAVPSENPPGDERAVAALCAERLRALGAEDVRIAGGSPERPNVLAHLPGRRPGPTLLLCGHVDTKPPGELADWTSDPFAAEVRDGRLYGLGACDMKGGVAAILVAAAALLEGDGIDRGAVAIALTADEEGGSTLGASWLARNGLLAADAAIIPEAAGIDRDWEMLAIGCRGGALFRVDVTGTTGHTALADRDGGTTATLAAARLIDRLDRGLRRLPGAAVNIGATISGGVNYGVRAATASFRCDVRFPDELTVADIDAVIGDTLARFGDEHPGVTTNVRDDEIEGAPYAATAVAPDSAVARACREAAADVLGTAPPDAIFPAATDSLFVQGIAGIPTMPAFGPGRLREAHRPDEYVSLSSLELAPQLLEQAARRFLAS